MILEMLSAEKAFLHTENTTYSYEELRNAILKNNLFLAKIPSGRAFAIEAENSIDTYQKFLSLIDSGHTAYLVPSYQFNDFDFRSFLEHETKTPFIYCPKDTPFSELNIDHSPGSDHPLLKDSLKDRIPRFIVRTSGSSGKKFKFILHNPQLFLNKYLRIGNHFKRTFAFSPAESIAGVETLLEALCHGNELICAGDRVSPRTVVELIHKHKIDYFQTTPTFLNLLMISGEVREEKLRSLNKIAFGSEPPQQTVLNFLRQKLPMVELMHTYGMSEIGIQRTKTSLEDPTILTMDDSFNPGRLIDGMLEIQSMTPMLGYFNDINENLEWFKTFDLAVPENNFWRILGRNSDLINLAGRKFFPIELEELLMNLDGVLDVIVIRENNEIVGNVVVASITIAPEKDEVEFRRSLKDYCKQNVPFYMHPQKVILQKNANPNPGSRFKKMRKI